jgi:ribosomal protein S12 methylthiotransferase
MLYHKLTLERIVRLLEKKSVLARNRKTKHAQRFYLVTLGCPKNEVDSEGMVEALHDSHLHLTDDPDAADYIIVNTCGFLQAARQEGIDTLRDFAANKHPQQKLIAAGCLAQRLGSDISAQVPGLDGIISIRHWPDIGRFLESFGTHRDTRPTLFQSEPGSISPHLHPLRRTDLGSRASAYLKVGDGCSASCAFCTIPSIKGPMVSRPRDLILEEARTLVDNGTLELILVAQDTTAYGRDRGEEKGLHNLLREILNTVPDVHWLRLMYTYPTHLDEELIEIMAKNQQVCHYLDMPLQHANPDVLARMRRPKNVERVLHWIEKLRQAVPDVALRTTFIVGFPGETKAEFDDLLSLMQTVQFDRVGVFPYSREPGTPAYDMPNQVPEPIKQERYKHAMQLQQGISLARNQRQIGRNLDVLVEGTDSGISIARSYRDAPEIDGYVLVHGKLPVGTMSRVRVIGATIYDLTAQPSPPESSEYD